MTAGLVIGENPFRGSSRKDMEREPGTVGRLALKPPLLQEAIWQRQSL